MDKRFNMPHPTTEQGVKGLSDEALWHWLSWHHGFIALMHKELKRRERLEQKSRQKRAA